MRKTRGHSGSLEGLWCLTVRRARFHRIRQQTLDTLKCQFYEDFTVFSPGDGMQSFDGWAMSAERQGQSASEQAREAFQNARRRWPAEISLPEISTACWHQWPRV
ncbi:hypothetical protein M404DRAFT_531550 [Pisolithus tinctorius Marx 270]|uniref:Uncharacterized protein n=1 Tax=Pisolithus tinctorius Marx 270 TaxID=870435 RepID=A0A0C3NVW7_PISTI|nr:hypothetical protein M404DRAFT_531550 [Pisolithus tinctorius Marx 270]